MPSEDLDSWGLSWSLPLPADANGDIAFEEGTLTLENGKDLKFTQSINGDQDITIKKYLLNKKDGSLSEVPSCDSCGTLYNRWILQPYLSSIKADTATFRMMRD